MYGTLYHGYRTIRSNLQIRLSRHPTPTNIQYIHTPSTMRVNSKIIAFIYV